MRATHPPQVPPVGDGGRPAVPEALRVQGDPAGDPQREPLHRCAVPYSAREVEVSPLSLPPTQTVLALQNSRMPRSASSRP